MVYPDFLIVSLDIFIRIYGNIAGITTFRITFYFTDGITVMLQAIALFSMSCSCSGALDLYSFFASQFNERLRSIFRFGRVGLFGHLVFALYGEHYRHAAGVGKFPLFIRSVPAKLYRAGLGFRVKGMVYPDFLIVSLDIFVRIYGNIDGITSLFITLNITNNKSTRKQAVGLVFMSYLTIRAVYGNNTTQERLYRIIAGFLRFGWVNDRRTDNFEHYKNAAGVSKLPLLIIFVPYKLYRANLILCFKRMP